MQRGALRLGRAAAVSLAVAGVTAAAEPAAGRMPTASASALAVGQPSISPSPQQVTLGSPVTVRGTAPQGAGISLDLEADAWPFRGYETLATVVTVAGGAYAFAPITPDRDTLLRVAVAGATQPQRSVAVTVTVFPRVRLTARALGPGRTLLTLGVRHLPSVAGADTVVRWFTATPGSSAFHLASVSGSTELPSGLLRAETIIDPPARRFTFRVCLNPPWEAAMGTGSDRGRCPRDGFVLRPGARR